MRSSDENMNFTRSSASCTFWRKFGGARTSHSAFCFQTLLAMAGVSLVAGGSVGVGSLGSGSSVFCSVTAGASRALSASSADLWASSAFSTCSALASLVALATLASLCSPSLPSWESLSSWESLPPASCSSNAVRFVEKMFVGTQLRMILRASSFSGLFSSIHAFSFAASSAMWSGCNRINLSHLSNSPWAFSSPSIKSSRDFFSLSFASGRATISSMGVSPY
mmetsp:Transcript_46710/g.145865  ORF Transcript_46710/g.145865 Transcript_46710/m.145865 type:complete len:223 (+) Transcript_46710:1030-1698(+)